ncbi:MAG: glucose-1-phosphate thymidylyltransferase [Candidatus Tectomicrobia bacterium]|nr:glucose-1-phosphate thymidylyltransferase [Candidatus Tectomicrobia bacterium]
MLRSSNFFSLDTFAHRALFDNCEVVWEILSRIALYIREIQTHLESRFPSSTACDGVKVFQAQGGRSSSKEVMLTVEHGLYASDGLFFKDLGIFIGKGTVIEAGVVIKPLTIIGENNEIRQGAYLRGSIITGAGCVVGHTTEVKNAVLLDDVEAAHFAYIGDSVVGNHVNLGAGTRLANLQLRTREERETKKVKPITIRIEGKEYQTGLTKFGAVLGDYVETGCNSVTSPGTLIGQESWVYANTTVPKGLYPGHSIISSEGRKVHLAKKRGTSS